LFEALAKCLIVLRQDSPELAEGLSMNGRNYNDFKVATVRPEPVEGCSSIFARGSFFTYIPNLEHFFCQNQTFILF
jgi:hypothetical protein